MNHRQEVYAIHWLCHIDGIGAVTIRNLYEYFQSFEYLYRIEEKELRESKILSERLIGCFLKAKSMQCACREAFDSLNERGISFVSVLDEGYPKRLTHLYDAPVGLFVRGSMPKEQKPTVAIIGARGCTNYGLQMAEHLSAELSERGIQIISGLASGIDSAGHKGALKVKQATYGVLGCGVTIYYPKENYYLYEEIVKNGGIISEYPLYKEPKAFHFPMRNRIISGLSDVIVVIEAREKSGSLITVNLGLEQGKEIFALPGRIDDPLSKGCNQLIKEGANCLLSSEDIIEYFGIKAGKMLRVDKKSENTLENKLKMVYSCLDFKPKYIEEIIGECRLSIAECMEALLELELLGMTVEVSNHHYGRKV